MILKNPKDINPDNEDDRSMKVYEISNHRDSEEDIKDNILSSDDSDMKIFGLISGS